MKTAAATRNAALRTALASACLAAATSAAQAADSIPAGARLAASCTGCHGTNGATQGNALPPLAGQPKEQLLAALKDFKAGKRQATIMTQLTKGYTDEQLEALASYFAAQRQGDAK
ncbi:cytochrome c [Pseudoduganella sp.]|uniref:c-type cytochrome n=1 Tax=Pseudoduganella sp. TaxID=1880898 RepID=UPI0035B255A7